MLDHHQFESGAEVQMADPRFVAFLAEVEQFVADFTAHNQGISAAVAKACLQPTVNTVLPAMQPVVWVAD